jgi:hypothetical protein
MNNINYILKRTWKRNQGVCVKDVVFLASLWKKKRIMY